MISTNKPSYFIIFFTPSMIVRILLSIPAAKRGESPGSFKRKHLMP